jgi:hypothetical protein
VIWETLWRHLRMFGEESLDVTSAAIAVETAYGEGRMPTQEELRVLISDKLFTDESRAATHIASHYLNKRIRRDFGDAPRPGSWLIKEGGDATGQR